VTATFLVFGAEGQLGFELVRELASLGRVVGLARTDADLTSADALRAAVRGARPTVVVNAAAYTAVDAAEEDAARCHLVNAVAPGVMAEEAARVGAAMIHFSTDYVFDGTLHRPYTEADAPNPLGVYGATKRDGELAVEAANGAYLTFRLSWVYGLRGRNFLRTMLRLARERDELAVVHDQIGAPTWSRLVAAGVLQALAAVAHSPAGMPGAIREVSGVYHLSAAGATSWHGFATALLEQDPARHEQRARVVRAIATRDFPTAARRPPYSVLDNDRVATTFGVRLPEWREQLRQAFGN
jgi:dTDP-4-dehydrorhamnose reductase